MSPLAFKSGFLIDFTDYKLKLQTKKNIIFLDFCTW